MGQGAGVTADLGFLPREAIGRFRAVAVPFPMVRHSKPNGQIVEPPPIPLEPVECFIADARQSPEAFTLDDAGFALIERPSSVKNWRDNDEVVQTYYEECRQLARELTGARHVFTYDHVCRDTGVQVYGGGLGAPEEMKFASPGDGYVSHVHLDYTDKSTFAEYLALHGVEEPTASRVVMLNFWRPIYAPAGRDPLAVCDARTIRYEDILELTLLGYLTKNYSWNRIGMNMARFSHSPDQRWYYYPQMTPDEVLVMRTYDSRGVMGRASGHGAFRLPDVASTVPPRRSVELRVLCYIDAD